jgi:hypothetical protein
MFFQVLRIRDVYPGSDFFPYRIPDSGWTRSRFPDSGSTRSRIPDPQEKNLGILKPKTRSGMFFPDTGSGYFPIPDPDPGVKKAPDPRVVDPDGPASIWLSRIRIWNADPDPRETNLIKIRTKATTYQTKSVLTNKKDYRFVSQRNF